MAKPWESYTAADLKLPQEEFPKLRRKSGKPRAPRTEAQKRGPKPKPPEEKRRRAAFSLLPGILAELRQARLDRVTIDRVGSESRIVELALLEYFGKRPDRKAEVVLNKFGQRAARVLAIYAKDALRVEVFRVLDDLAKAVGEDWRAEDFQPAPDELNRLRAENRMLRDALKHAYRTTDAEVEAWLTRGVEVANPDDLRDGRVTQGRRQYLRPAAELVEDEDDGRNSMGLRLGGEPFMG